jgi:hypothetical protein
VHRRPSESEHMPDNRTAPEVAAVARRAFALLLALAVLAPALALDAEPAAARATGPSRAAQLSFMWAVAGQESGWNHFARNPTSGAFGKYQIMPFNWPNWAGKYLGNRHADQTPANQERVAWGRIRDLYRWLGSWRRVAYWWLTGRTERNERRWTAYAKGYVDNVMALRKRAPRDGGLSVVPTRGSMWGRGDWRRAQEPLRLRLSPGGRPWPRRGRLAAGEVVRIRAVRTTRNGARWLRVVTANGRLGWVKAVLTVPARQPARPGRWSQVLNDGRERPDRSRVRPRPR